MIKEFCAIASSIVEAIDGGENAYALDLYAGMVRRPQVGWP